MNTIKGLRVTLGKTQLEMAEYLNISRQAYSNKERGILAFNDREKIALKQLFLQVDSDVTIDSLFFTNKVS